jgi:single-stranded DNA-binding protein
MISTTFIGRIVRDAEMRNGAASFTVAVDVYSKDDPKGTAFIQVYANGLSENFVKYLKKGKPVMVTGDLTVNTYQKKDGTWASGMKVSNATVGFVSIGSSQNKDGAQQKQSYVPQQKQQGSGKAPADLNPPAEEEVPDLDIPF